MIVNTNNQSIAFLNLCNMESLPLLCGTSLKHEIPFGFVFDHQFGFAKDFKGA